MEADDGDSYVVKFLNNRHHPRILVDELLTHRLLAYLRLSVPAYALVNVSGEDLIASSRDLVVEYSERALPVCSQALDTLVVLTARARATTSRLLRWRPWRTSKSFEVYWRLITGLAMATVFRPDLCETITAAISIRHG